MKNKPIFTSLSANQLELSDCYKCCYKCPLGFIQFKFRSDHSILVQTSNSNFGKTHFYFLYQMMSFFYKISNKTPKYSNCHSLKCYWHLSKNVGWTPKFENASCFVITFSCHKNRLFNKYFMGKLRFEVLTRNEALND